MANEAGRTGPTPIRGLYQRGEGLRLKGPGSSHKLAANGILSEVFVLHGVLIGEVAQKTQRTEDVPREEGMTKEISILCIWESSKAATSPLP